MNIVMEQSMPIPFSGCWLWLGGVNGNGYGRITHNGKRVMAHRLSKELEGYDIAGKNVCHTCDVPICVNPAHLFVGTQADNLSDMRSKNRHKNPPLKQGESHYEKRLSEDDVLSIRTLYQGKRGQLKELAAKFGVTYGMVGHIVHRRKWKHI